MKVRHFEFNVREVGRSLSPGEAPSSLELPILCESYEVTLKIETPEGEIISEKSRFHGWNFSSGAGDGEKLREALLGIQTSACDEESLRYVGGLLWDNLLGTSSGTLEKVFQKHRDAVLARNEMIHVRLILPDSLRSLPWETLHDRRDGFLVRHNQYAIVRDAPELNVLATPKRDGKMSVLLVVPRGSRLDVQREEQLIRDALDRHKVTDQVTLDASLVYVTPDALRDKLRRGPWDLVHFIGHGGEGTVRLNYDEGDDDKPYWLKHNLFAELFTGTRVRSVLLNCCHGDTPQPRRAFGGLGPLLRQQGVAAVVVMRYELSDRSAIKFSQRFYHALCSPDQTGRVDLAVNTACDGLRTITWEETRAPFTPALYLARGEETLVDLKPPAPIVIKTSSAKLPEELSIALREGRCVVLAGPGILKGSATATRHSTSQPPGAWDLVEQLATNPQVPYPSQKDIQLCRTGGEAFATQLMQWVCQHYASNEREDILLKSLGAAYHGCACPDEVKLMASWPVRALFYTFFDGLFERALLDAKPPARSLETFTLTGLKDPNERQILNGWSERLRAAPALPASRLLVLLRGSLAVRGSLKLNEEHHEELWDEIGRMAPSVSSLVTDGGSLLILGADPSEPLVHRLAQKLLPILGGMKTFGPTFIVWTGEPTPRDRNYWKRYKTQWITTEVEEAIRAITQVWA
jgi:hypothetical protein